MHARHTISENTLKGRFQTEVSDWFQTGIRLVSDWYQTGTGTEGPESWVGGWTGGGLGRRADGEDDGRMEVWSTQSKQERQATTQQGKPQHRFHPAQMLHVAFLHAHMTKK